MDRNLEEVTEQICTHLDAIENALVAIRRLQAVPLDALLAAQWHNCGPDFDENGSDQQ